MLPFDDDSDDHGGGFNVDDFDHSVVHNFDQCLKRSQSHAAADWWEVIYRKAFNGIAAMVDVRKDGWAQRGGIDRVVTLCSGRTITIDEKVREKDYGDILLERWSDRQRRKPGWVQKPLACEFIAYAVAPTRICYLLPTLTLQRAWREYGPDWINRYDPIIARNFGYETESIAVPVDVLFAALTGAMTVTWRP